MNMNNIDSMLAKIMLMNGAIATALIDWESGMTLGADSNGKFDIELAAAGNSDVIKTKMEIMKSLGLSGSIKDIVITLEDQIHLIMIVPSDKKLALYLALDSEISNPALARMILRKAVA